VELAGTAPDLFLLEPIGELPVIGTRLRDAEVAERAIARLDDIVHALGAPAPWVAQLAWARLQAAVVADDAAHRDGVRRAAATLGALASPADGGAPIIDAFRMAAATWAAVVDGQVDLASVREAAATLDAAGLVWEAASLAGGAAIRSLDPLEARLLLDDARVLRGRLPSFDPADGAPAGVLTEREREIAAGVLDGLTHKQIGALLFLSPKTVEHNVARIRTKVGATDRAEMISRLRDLLDR